MINEFYLNKLYSDSYKDFSVYEQQPSTVRPTVTQGDAENGYIYRYFVRQVNDESFIVEVDEKQYDEFQNNPRFITCKIRWKIVGKKENLNVANNVIIYGVLDVNRQVVANADLTFGGLRKYIVDYAQFWVGETI